MKIGVTGHQRLDNPDEVWPWVEQKMAEELVKLTQPFIGITSLAIGADQKFAEVVLKYGGKLHVVLPFENYEKVLAEDEHRKKYLELVEKASAVETVPVLPTKEESYLAAGKRVMEMSNVVFAVWNGQAAAGLGGTGDAVKYALQLYKRVIHINPTTVQVKVLNS